VLRVAGRREQDRGVPIVMLSKMTYSIGTASYAKESWARWVVGQAARKRYQPSTEVRM